MAVALDCLDLIEACQSLAVRGSANVFVTLALRQRRKKGALTIITRT